MRKQYVSYLTGDKTKAQKVNRLAQWAARNSSTNAARAASAMPQQAAPPPPASPPPPAPAPSSTPAATPVAGPLPPPPAAATAPAATAPSGGLWSRIKSALGLQGQQSAAAQSAAQPASHPLAPPAMPASPQPGAPPAPLFTGVDTNGHHWVNGKQVAKPPDETHWETGKAQPGSLNGVDFKSAPPKFWEKTPDKDIGEPAPLKKIDRVSVMIQEPDGRVWIVQPTNGYGQRKFTLAGGGVEAGLSNQQNALKEVWEETGLHVEITGHLGDFEDSNNGKNGRLYVGKRVGGAPWDAKVESFLRNNKTGQPAAESEAVSLVTLEKAAQLLHRTDDLAQLMAVHPPKIDTPTSGKGSEPLKKFLKAIQPKAQAYVAKQKAARGAVGSPDLHAVQEMRGYNKKPNVVTKNDMDALVAKGDHIEMLRGLKDHWSGAKAKDMAEEFRSGDHFPGFGCFGDGTYADATKGRGNASVRYAGGAGAGAGSVIRMALPKTAKIITFAELEKKVPRAPDDFKDPDGHGKDMAWYGIQAALAGYDAIHVDGKQTLRHVGYGTGFHVILNRSVLVVQQEDATGHEIK